MPNPIRLILAAVAVLGVANAPARAACQITGPNTAIVNQSFTLCAPSISGSTYEWYGTGISTSTYARCIDVDGLANGGYEFVLVRRVNDVEVDRCTKVVNIGTSTGGVESCVITGPETIDEGSTATLCAPQDGIHSYAWTGPTGATSSAGCITVSDEGTYSLTSRNRLTGSSRTCTHRLVVNGYTGGGVNGVCDISGPSTVPAGSTVQLCAPSVANTSYRWTGPGGFVASSRCVNVDNGGTFGLTMRNLSTGRTTRCSQVMTLNDQGSSNMCGIEGPTTIPAGSTVQLCAPSYANTSYRWTGPGGFAASSRCVNVAGDGTFVLTMRNLSTGRTTRCSQVMTLSDQGDVFDDPDSPVSDNCPRDFQFWRGVLGASGSGSGTNVSRAELLQIARAVDMKSSYLSWSNDVNGLRQALSPTETLTRRKQVIRQFVTLLANVAAGEANLTSDDGNNIGLDLDTAVNFGGAGTIGELIALTDRLLTSNRGNFAKLNSTLNLINRGRGIGSTCE